MSIDILIPEQLRAKVNLDKYDFNLASEFVAEGHIFQHQDRAIKALNLGLKIRHPDYNIYIAGPKETGRLDLAMMYCEQIVRELHNHVSDWCYLFNFKDIDSPKVVSLQKGGARILKNLMKDFIESLKIHIPQLFEGENYVTTKEEIIRKFNNARNDVFTGLDQKAREQGFMLQADQGGMLVIPIKSDGNPLNTEDVAKLTLDEQNILRQKADDIHKDMAASMRKIHQLEHEVKNELKNLDKELVKQICEQYIQPLRDEFKEHKEIKLYLDEVIDDITQNYEDFKHKPEQSQFPFAFTAPTFTQYEINIVVDNSEKEIAPIIFEENPSYPNLFGNIERKAQFGALFTDFTMIKSGSLHKANGGFLIIKILDLLKNPFSYEALKRAIRSRKINIEDPYEQMGVFSTKTIKPEPIPLDLKIILVGDSYYYDLLYQFDEDFRTHFKIKSHLDINVEKNDESIKNIINVINQIVKKENIQDLNKSALARLIEYSSETTDYQDKLNLKINELTDFLIETNYWALQDNASVIDFSHVEKSIEERKYRSNLYEQKLQEFFIKDIIKVKTSGKKTGQINGLAVYGSGDYSFGKPSRITVNISMGKDGIINIEREAELSGKFHTKGIMILSGYLRSMFAQKMPLTLNATICFEQSYGMIDGDSASAAELFALLSAISGIPIKQSLAVTGAVSQKGEILPIGGVNEKIHGFFDVCFSKGLTGEQGVIIPKSNVKNLMLKKEVIEAVSEGKFHIWSVETVEDGIELLMDMPAGIPDEQGNYPENTLFNKVSGSLKFLAEEARKFASEEKEKKESKGEETVASSPETDIK